MLLMHRLDFSEASGLYSAGAPAQPQLCWYMGHLFVTEVQAFICMQLLLLFFWCLPLQLLL